VRVLENLSGPWEGWSVQEGRRISERFSLTIRGGRISATGKDADGEFELLGAYYSRDQKVLITRCYTRTTEPSQEGVGIPYEYQGYWDGQLISGRWHPRWVPQYGGEFEMWPATDENIESLRIGIEDVVTAGQSR